MPGTSPGRRQPVRGVASQIITPSDNEAHRLVDLNHPVSSASLPWETPIQRASVVSSRERHLAPQPNSWDASRDDVRHERHANADLGRVQQMQQRPFSSGYPAPARAVPIVRGGGIRASPALQFPDSPPSTPPQSPPLTPRAIHDASHDPLSLAYNEVANEEEIEALRTPMARMSVGGGEQQQNLIAEAANAILNSSAGRRLQHQPQSQQQTADKAEPTVMHGGAGLMPATPEMSPDQEVQHFALKCARAFFEKTFLDFAAEAKVEDAGVELICAGWAGAVLKTGSSSDDAGGHSASFTSMNSSSSSGASSTDSKRTLYVSMPALVDQSQLREQVLALLDAASEKLGCESVILCLDRHMRDFATVLHGLCYVGGQVVCVGAGSSSRDPAGDDSEATWRSSTTVDATSGFSPRRGLVLVGIEL